MKLKVSAVVKKDKKWYAGYINGTKFTTNKEITSPLDIKDANKYISLKKYLILKNEAPDVEDNILKELEFQKIYILEKPIDPSAEEFKEYWWSGINDLCDLCNKNCKQSNKVHIVNCPSFASDEKICDHCSINCNTKGHKITMCSSFTKKVGK